MSSRLDGQKTDSHTGVRAYYLYWENTSIEIWYPPVRHFRHSGFASQSFSVLANTNDLVVEILSYKFLPFIVLSLAKIPSRIQLGFPFPNIQPHYFRKWQVKTSYLMNGLLSFDMHQQTLSTSSFNIHSTCLTKSSELPSSALVEWVRIMFGIQKKCIF